MINMTRTSAVSSETTVTIRIKLTQVLYTAAEPQEYTEMKVTDRRT